MKCFSRISDDILKIHDCVIYYTADMNEEIPNEDKDTDWGQMKFFVVPVTLMLLTEPNRVMESDLDYAKKVSRGSNQRA